MPTRRRNTPQEHGPEPQSRALKTPLVPLPLVSLCTYDQLPAWQKDNHLIRTGYVRETKSVYRCFQSLFFLHNETGNIYTHLVPGLVALLVFLVPVYPVYPTTDASDRFVLALFTFGALTCLLCLATFHCLKCHSALVASRFNKLDYVGIIVLIATSMTGIIHYSFLHHRFYRLFFLCMTGAFSLGCFVVSVDDQFRQPEWRSTRAGMFVMFGLSSILPIITGIWLLGWSEAARVSQIWWVVAEGVLYIGGAGLYAARFPERLDPGRFDYFGNGHQLFHILVVAAAGCHAKALWGSYRVAHHLV